jgi:hypothetical protein
MKPQLPKRAHAIRRAVSILGGTKELAERLKVPERQVDYWIQEIVTPPDSVFFDVIDIIIESAGARDGELVEAGRRNGKSRHRDTFFQ